MMVFYSNYERFSQKKKGFQKKRTENVDFGVKKYEKRFWMVQK